MTSRTAESMLEEALRWSREDLCAHWTTIRSRGDIATWSPGKAFEYLVLRAFDLERATVRWPYSVVYPQKFGTLEQVDGFVYIDHRAFIVESKDMTEPVAIETIAKLRFRLEGRPPGTMAVLFSVSNFSLPTEVFAQFASPLNVLLWGCSDLDVALPAGTMLECLRQKLEFATEHGLPLFSFGMPK